MRPNYSQVSVGIKTSGELSDLSSSCKDAINPFKVRTARLHTGREGGQTLDESRFEARVTQAARLLSLYLVNGYFIS